MDVQRQLEHLSGPRLPVTAAVWAELMRTRTNPDPSLAAVACIQEKSGSRIHIERESQEIQLFGPKQATVIAQQLLHELESVCILEAVDVECSPYPDPQRLQAFAQEFCVTVELTEKQLIVLGVKGAVVEAVHELRDHEGRLQQVEAGLWAGDRSNAARLAIESAMLEIQTAISQVAASATAHFSPFAEEGGEGQQQCALEESRHSSLNMPPYQPQRLDLLRPPDVCQTCGVGNFCAYCGVRTYKCLPQCSYDNCAECGATNFCFSCGRPTTMMNRTTTVQAASFVDVRHASMQGDSWTSLNPIMTGQCVQTDTCGAVAVCIPVAMIPFQQGFPILVGV